MLVQVLYHQKCFCISLQATSSSWLCSLGMKQRSVESIKKKYQERIYRNIYLFRTFWLFSLFALIRHWKEKADYHGLYRAMINDPAILLMWWSVYLDFVLRPWHRLILFFCVVDFKVKYLLLFISGNCSLPTWNPFVSFSSLLEAVKRNTWACLVFLRSNSSIIQIRHQILGLVVNHRSYHILCKMIICWPPKVCNQDIDERWRKQNSTVVIPLNWYIQRHVNWRWCLRSVASTPCNFRCCYTVITNYQLPVVTVVKYLARRKIDFISFLCWYHFTAISFRNDCNFPFFSL